MVGVPTVEVIVQLCTTNGSLTCEGDHAKLLALRQAHLAHNLESTDMVETTVE